MSVQDDAAKLEGLIPQAITALFHTGEEDPLRHHSVGQIRLMRTLLAGSRTASDLSQRLGLSPSSLTQMVSRMIGAGLVSKELDSSDRRVRKLSLTPAGRTLMEDRQAKRARAAAQLLAKMEPGRLQSLMDLMEEIIALKKDGNYLLVEAV